MSRKFVRRERLSSFFLPCLLPSSNKRRVREKPDRAAGLDICRILGEFDEAVGLRQRSQHAGAFLRVLDGIDAVVRCANKPDPDIFAPALTLALAKSGA